MIAHFGTVHRLATIFSISLFVDAGGMMSYRLKMEEGHHIAAGRVARVLKGAKPSDPLVQQSTRFNFVVKFKLAKSPGITSRARFLYEPTM
jgi:ABC-type uncharacterized transport system substrate-binding protein